MAKRKYCNFVIEFEDNTSFETQDYREVFRAYQRNDTATIYGLPNYDGAQYEVIMCK